ncbi:MAG TPA: lipocalin family protein [Edaphocola sp.]|nr:lipocalin family protein [Edaphocola sp.]
MRKLLFVIAAITFLASSCSKNDSQDRKKMMLGTWTLIELGEDLNTNGNLDNGETQPASSYGVSGYYTFNEDGTAVSSVTIGTGSQTSNVNWSLTNNDQNLYVSSGSQSVTFPIKELTKNRLVLLNTDSSPGTWNVYSK